MIEGSWYTKGYSCSLYGGREGCRAALWFKAFRVLAKVASIMQGVRGGV